VTHLGDTNNGGSGCPGDPYVIARVYRIVDACGNSFDVTQALLAVDNTNPIANAPEAVFVDCVSDVPPVDVSVVTGASYNCSAVAITFVGESDNGGSGCPDSPLVLIRTYRIADVCGNAIEVTHTITAIDDVSPTATTPAPIAVQCVSDIPDPDLNLITDAEDNCGAPVVTFVSDTYIGGSGCANDPWLVERKYRVTDVCGNALELVQTISAMDDTAPTAVDLPEVTLSCIADVPQPDIEIVIATDNCSETTVTHIADINNGGTGCINEPIVAACAATRSRRMA
jgi:hypothetical protein